MVPIHLWGFQVTESAPSTPAHRWRHSGSSMAVPAIAASTWTQAPWGAATSTIRSTGSKGGDPGGADRGDDGGRRGTGGGVGGQ